MEIGGAIKRRNATDAQVTIALEVIVQGMILEKKLEGTRQEEKMEALMDSNKFSAGLSCVCQRTTKWWGPGSMLGFMLGKIRGGETHVEQGAVNGLLVAEFT